MLVDGKPFLVARVTDATIEALAAFEAAREDLEDDSEDRCPTADDQIEGGTAPGFGNGADWIPGDPDDAEEGDPKEDDDPPGAEHDGREPETLDIAIGSISRLGGWWGDADPRKL